MAPEAMTRSSSSPKVFLAWVAATSGISISSPKRLRKVWLAISPPLLNQNSTNSQFVHSGRAYNPPWERLGSSCCQEARQRTSGPDTGRDRDLQSIRIDHREVAGSPGLFSRLVGELAAAFLDDGGELVDVLPGDAVEPERDTLRPVAPLGEVVLPKEEYDASRRQVSRHQAV